MGIYKQKEASDIASATKTESFAKETVKPLIVRVRPGLANDESAYVDRLPQSYRGKTVRDVLGYVAGSKGKDDMENQTIASLKRELGAAGSVVVINGKKAKLTDKIDQYLVDKEKDVGGRQTQYQQLEMEVSAVQQGGYLF